VRKGDNLPPSCAVVTKSGNLNFLEPRSPSGPVTGLLYLYLYLVLYNIYWECHFQIDMTFAMGKNNRDPGHARYSFRKVVLSRLLSRTQYISLETDNFDACSIY